MNSTDELRFSNFVTSYLIDGNGSLPLIGSLPSSHDRNLRSETVKTKWNAARLTALQPRTMFCSFVGTVSANSPVPGQ